MEQISFCGRNFLASSPQLNVWRAPTDNDGVKAWIGNKEKNTSNLISVSTLNHWLNLGLDQLKLTNRICKVSKDYTSLNNGINKIQKNWMFHFLVVESRKLDSHLHIPSKCTDSCLKLCY